MEAANRFQRLWADSRVAVSSYLASLVPYRAMVEDCLQEVALLSWQKGPKDRGQEEFLAYCMGCARLVAKGAIRKQRIGKLHFLAPDVALSLAEATAEQHVKTEESDRRIPALRECVAALDGAQREILEARYSRNHADTLKSKADALKRSPGSIYKQLERIRTSLRDCVRRKIEHES